MARLREHPAPVRTRRTDLAGAVGCVLRQALRPSRRRGRGRWARRDGGRRRGGPRRCAGHARRGGARAGRAPALGLGGRSRRAARSARPGRGRARHRGPGELGRARPIRRQLDPDRAAGSAARVRAADQGAGTDARRQSGPDRAALRVRRERPARRDALDRSPTADQPLRRPAGTAGGRPVRQPRGRCRGRRPPARRCRDRGGGRRAAWGTGRSGRRAQQRPLGDAVRRSADRLRPARHRHRMDGTDLAAEHVRGHAGLRPRQRTVRPGRRCAARRTSSPRVASSATGRSASWSPTASPSGRRRHSARPAPVPVLARRCRPVRTGRTRLARPGRPRHPVPALRPAAHPELFRSTTHGFVDMCEDVSLQGHRRPPSKEGYDSVELVKRYTTVTMGPTQGKLETVNAVAMLAEATGRTIAETGTTTWRPDVRAADARRAGRPGTRTGPLLPDAVLARPPRRHAARRGTVDPARALRRPRRRGDGPCGRRRRDHRRDPDREAGPARAGRRAAAQPALREQVVEARRSAASATASCAPRTVSCSTTVSPGGSARTTT